MTDKPVYLDYNATTPMDPRVLEAMVPWFLTPANAGSRTHSYGRSAKEAIERSRQQVSNVLKVQPEEIYFTSGATESNNIAILGLAEHGEKTGRKHILSTAIEHKAVLEPLEYLSTKGFEIELVPVGSGGFVDPEDVVKRCRKDTLLVSVMHANNETGVIQPVKEIGEQMRASETWFHVDAAQTFGKEPDLADIDCDLLSVSSHKIYGPQGIGALYVKRQGSTRIPISSLIHGGGQERGLRPGTVSVALAVGFGEASKIAKIEHHTRAEASQVVRDAFLRELAKIDFVINGDLSRCQKHVVNVRFPGVDSEALMMALRVSLAVSNGSACTSDSYDPSHVLQAMGLSEDEANESIRISWGANTQTLPVDRLITEVERLRIQF